MDDTRKKFANDPAIWEAFRHGRTRESAIQVLQSIEFAASEALKTSTHWREACRDIRDIARQNIAFFSRSQR